jgi:hypothetical protein
VWSNVENDWSSNTLLQTLSQLSFMAFSASFHSSPKELNMQPTEMLLNNQCLTHIVLALLITKVAAPPLAGCHQCAKTLSIAAFSITTFRIMGLFATLSKNNTQH